jgi:hypothetical protein
MSEQPTIGKPAISDDFVRANTEVIAKLEAVPEQQRSAFDRQWLEMVKRTTSAAVAAAQYQPPPGDTRSPAEQALDRSFGLSPRHADQYAHVNPSEHAPQETLTAAREALAVARADPNLANGILHDLAANPKPDPVAVKAALAAMGRDYDTVVDAANRALGGKLPVARLPLHSLLMLGIQGDLLKRRHAAASPKK